MAPRSSTLAWKIHGRRSLVGCSPWGREESDMTEQLHFHFSVSSIGEGNGNPLQCSCLENPRDRGAWWAAVYGVAKSRTQLKRLSSSSSSMFFLGFILYRKSLCFLHLIDYFLSHVRKVFDYNLFKYAFQTLSLFFFSWDPCHSYVDVFNGGQEFSETVSLPFIKTRKCLD